jgi:hypothetical protein
MLCLPQNPNGLTASPKVESSKLSEIGNSVCFRFRALVPGYQMDGYIRAPGFVLYPYVFVAGPNKHDCSRRTLLRGKF